MKHYAMISYPSRALTPEELKQRRGRDSELGQRRHSQGNHLDPAEFRRAGRPVVSFERRSSLRER